MLDEFGRAQRVARDRVCVVPVLRVFLQPGNVVSNGIPAVRLGYLLVT
jgi:uracil phosphoribosyltransferase